MPQTTGTFGGIQNLVVNEDDFMYVQTEKIYILHMIEKKPGFQDKTSFSNAPLGCLLDGVFQSREAAEAYASFYMTPGMNPGEKSRLKDYLEDKYFKIFDFYQMNNMGNCIWETLLTVLLEADNIRKQIVDGIMTILALPVCRLYGLVSVVQVL